MQERRGDEKLMGHLLSSGLPLELLVAERLTEHGFFVSGPYAYPRLNENNVMTEFSADIHAFELTSNGDDTYWGNISVLVECKYSHPGVSWVFAPHPVTVHGA